MQKNEEEVKKDVFCTYMWIYYHQPSEIFSKRSDLFILYKSQVIRKAYASLSLHPISSNWTENSTRLWIWRCD